MRYPMQLGLLAAAMTAVAASGNGVVATAPPEGLSIILAQAQQPATLAPTTAGPATGGQQPLPGTPTMVPGQMMEHGQGMGAMGRGMAPGGQGHPGPMMGDQGHPGPAGGTPPCPPGQTASGTPPTCK